MLVVAVGLGCAGVKAHDATGGGQSGAGAQGGSRGAGGNCSSDLRAAVRDFRSGEQNGQPKHPDFEYMVGDDRGIVATMLGPDSKPVYAGGPNGTFTTTGKANFDQWYRDVDGINIHIDVSIPLVQDATRPGVYLYDNDLFYPIDDMGWGNQYLEHNQDFTVEIHFTFPYGGGEVFNFRGDDDLFLFVNGHLAVDLGGVHSAQTASLDLDARAADLDIAPGSSYQMDIFYADRHCCQSTFHVETTLQCITNVIVP
jgi:fibro-slime domain-containing protein